MTQNKTCIFDNPETFRREYWRNGNLIGWYTKEFLDQADKILTIDKKMEPYVGKFQPGRILGELTAIRNVI